MNKVKTKSYKNLILVCIIAFSQQANSGVFSNCFRGSGDGSYSEITAKKLTSRIRKSVGGGVCFQRALCAAGLEGSLSDEDVSAITEATHIDKTPGGPDSNYTEQYKRIMGLESANVKGGIGVAGAAGEQLLAFEDITESGFINFIHKATGEFFHTIFVQATSGGRIFLYQANDASNSR